MSISSSALATHPAAALTPRVIPFEVAGDELACFASESDLRGETRAATRTLGPPTRPAAEPARTPRRPPIVVRVPKHLGGGVVALLTGAFCGLVIAAVASPVERRPLGVGRVRITSSPPGTPVVIDNAPRGVTPVTAILPVGAHHVTIGSGAESRPRLIRVTPGGESSVHIEWAATPVADPVVEPAAPTTLTAETNHVSVTAPEATPPAAPVSRPAAPPSKPTASAPAAGPPRIPEGWLTVKSAFPVRVLLDGVEIGSSAEPRLALPAGRRTIVLVNDDLEFRAEHEVTIAARRSQALVVEPPQGVLHANARPWAEVWVDGRRAGETPIGNLPLPIGEHEVLFRHPRLGQSRQHVTVGARTPARVSVEFVP